MFKKILLYVSGPGMIFYLGVVLFIHLFTDKNLILWMIPAIVVFFVIFLPVYSIENFKNQDKKSREKKGDIRFSEKYKRTEWEGGNIHGKVLSKKDRPGFMEKRK